MREYQSISPTKWDCKYHIVFIPKCRKRVLYGKLHRELLNRKRNFSGEHFWARGYFISTVGLDEAMVREYIRNQEKEDERLEPLTLGLEKRDPL
jgi:putative transposase